MQIVKAKGIECFTCKCTEFDGIGTCLVIFSQLLRVVDAMVDDLLRSNSLQMQLTIPGITQGEETREILVASLIFLRLLGALALFLLFASSRVADEFLTSVAGVQMSVIEILIVISTVTQSFRTVRLFHFYTISPSVPIELTRGNRIQVERSVQESRTNTVMTRQFQPFLNKS